MQDQIPAVEDTYLARQFGLFELLRRVREDQLSGLTPAVFARRLIRFRLLRVQYFVVNWPDYIEHVLLTNAQNYVKGRFAEALLGPIVGEGLLISEGEAWRRRRRIEAPAFHHRSTAGLVDEMAHCHQIHAGAMGSADRAIRCRIRNDRSDARYHHPNYVLAPTWATTSPG